MNELKLRLELQGSMQQYIENFLNQGIPAHMLEDAMSKTMLFVKEKAVTEFLIQEQQIVVKNEEVGENIE